MVLFFSRSCLCPAKIQQFKQARHPRPRRNRRIDRGQSGQQTQLHSDCVLGEITRATLPCSYIYNIHCYIIIYNIIYYLLYIIILSIYYIFHHMSINSCSCSYRTMRIIAHNARQFGWKYRSEASKALSEERLAIPSLVLQNHAPRDVNKIYCAVNRKVSNMLKSNAPNSIDNLSSFLSPS